jgi:hypothetical protein
MGSTTFVGLQATEKATSLLASASLAGSTDLNWRYLCTGLIKITLELMLITHTSVQY